MNSDANNKLDTDHKPAVVSESCFGNYNDNDILCSQCEVAAECYTETNKYLNPWRTTL